jgi:hypothetical protein
MVSLFIEIKSLIEYRCQDRLTDKQMDGQSTRQFVGATSLTPNTWHPLNMANLAAARTAAFIPCESPPLVKMPTDRNRGDKSENDWAGPTTEWASSSTRARFLRL